MYIVSSIDPAAKKFHMYFPIHPIPYKLYGLHYHPRVVKCRAGFGDALHDLEYIIIHSKWKSACTEGELQVGIVCTSM